MVVRLDLAYDGSGYCGWQSQEGQNTVQKALEKALEKIYKKRPRLYAAGRTDTGVHARHQCCAFWVEDSLEPHIVQKALRSFLPPSIHVWQVRFEEDGFDPRKNTLARCYEYYVDPRPRCEPWRVNYVWPYHRQIDFDRLGIMASLIIGEHDFSGFCSAQDPSPSKSRLVFQSHWRQEAGLLVYRVTANAFLWRMVRRLVGAMVRLSSHHCGPDSFLQLLQDPTKYRDPIPAPAPASGLYLHKVIYHAHDLPH